MPIKHRLEKLEKKMGGDFLPYITVLVDEDEDEEIAINEKLKAEGVKRDQSNIIIVPFF